MLALSRTCALRPAGIGSKKSTSRHFLPSPAVSRLLSTSSLVIVEQRDGKLNVSSLSSVTAAQKLGGSITAFVAGPKAVAEEVSKIKNIEKVLMLDNSAYDKVWYLR